jgi:hypothetical protein
MTFGSSIRWGLVAAIAVVAVACGEPKKEPGPDPTTESDASIVPWSDGKPAIALSCKRPGGCQQRAQAMCPGGYKTLKSDNMPVSGGTAIYTTTSAAGATIRCN